MFSHPLASVAVTAAPTLVPVSLEAVKAHLRVTHTEQDDYLQGLLGTAAARVEAMGNVRFLTQTVEIAYDGAPTGDVLLLPCEPIQSVTQVVTYDSADTPSVLAPSEYFVDLQHAPPRLCLAASGTVWPCGLRPRRSLVVTCVAGWTNANNIPPMLTHAVKVLIAHWYTQPQTIGDVSDQILTLMAPYPRWGFA